VPGDSIVRIIKRQVTGSIEPLSHSAHGVDCPTQPLGIGGLSLRQRVIYDLTPRVGFPFSDVELSPSVRKSVGELEPLYKQLDDRSTEFSRLSKQRSNLQFITLAIGAFGLVFALAGFASWQLAIVGIIFLGGAAIFAFLTFNDNTEKMKTRRSEISELTKTARFRLSALSKAIYDELSAMHATKVNPQNSTTTVKETIVKEVVMIPCSYCKGLMPQTSVFCPECGARRKG